MGFGNGRPPYGNALFDLASSNAPNAFSLFGAVRPPANALLGFGARTPAGSLLSGEPVYNALLPYAPRVEPTPGFQWAYVRRRFEILGSNLNPTPAQQLDAETKRAGVIQ